MSDLINISFGDAALTALLGYLVVFFGLVLLMVVVIITVSYTHLTLPTKLEV